MSIKSVVLLSSICKNIKSQIHEEQNSDLKYNEKGKMYLINFKVFLLQLEQ